MNSIIIVESLEIELCVGAFLSEITFNFPPCIIDHYLNYSYYYLANMIWHTN